MTTPAWGDAMNRFPRRAARGAGALRCLLIGLLLGLLPGSGAMAQSTSEAVDQSALRVCADPGNLPFSDRSGAGFENRIAELLAEALGVPLRYTWFPQATGFVRNTLAARRCDLVTGVSLGFELLQNTNPYYRSAYVLVQRRDGGPGAASLDDPALRDRTIGVVAGTPPASLLVGRGLIGKARPYPLMVDARFERPGEKMIHDIATGEIDAGLLWGPIAGYYASKSEVPLTLLPLTAGPEEPAMAYYITMGVRFGEPEWKQQVNRLLDEKQAEIQAILQDYGVPLLDRQGKPIEP
ncbi:MAG: substrate-binding domain-containing protein [Tistlia sp.]|uniref:substrate-binding domain-containing protein n=1 Tax=Tistlia sp. TaxID=3057121 RepID=UPI0034A57D61